MQPQSIALRSWLDKAPHWNEGYVVCVKQEEVAVENLHRRAQQREERRPNFMVKVRSSREGRAIILYVPQARLCRWAANGRPKQAKTTSANVAKEARSVMVWKRWMVTVVSCAKFQRASCSLSIPGHDTEVRPMAVSATRMCVLKENSMVTAVGLTQVARIGHR